MKKHSHFILIAFIACTSAKQEVHTAENKDSIVTTTVANTPAVETSVSIETIEEPAEISDDTTASTLPIDLNSFAQYPLGYGDYASIVKYLKDANIEFTDQNKDSGLQAINFGESDITVLVTEAYGDLICTARIYNPAFEFPDDVRVGMLQKTFLSRAFLTTDSLSASGSQLYYERSGVGTNVGGTSTVRFIFEMDKLYGVEYDFDPCMIYD